MQNPATTDVEFLEHLKKADVPAFAKNLADHLGQFKKNNTWLKSDFTIRQSYPVGLTRKNQATLNAY